MTTRITTDNITDGTIAAADLSNLPNLVDWQSVVVADGSTETTAEAGKGYLIHISSATHTINLPASPSFGDYIAITDVAGTSVTNAITVGRNGSKIAGETNNVTMSSLAANRTFIYTGSDYGWVAQNSDGEDPTFISATGGTETTSGDFKIHTFTSSSNFVVSCVSNVSANNEVSYLVVAGGGGGGSNWCGAWGGSGGGGAGGFRESKSGVDTYTASPIEGSSPITVTATTYPITVGAGGTAGVAGPAPAGSGSNSVFSTITSSGGGFGQNKTPAPQPNSGDAASGGSAGGESAPSGGPRGGNSPPVSPAQGSPGGMTVAPAGGPAYSSGGGGGATASGQQNNPVSTGGNGGAGASTSISGTSVAYAGGGGGGAAIENGVQPSGAGTGGTGGGGNGGNGTTGSAGSTNRGGGGGGSGATSPSGRAASAGGSGIVIIRYKYQ